MQIADLATILVKKKRDKNIRAVSKWDILLGADGAKTSTGSGSSRICGKRIRLALPESAVVLVGFIMGDMENAVVFLTLFLHNSENPLPRNL